MGRSKDQLISKCFFGVVKYLKKTELKQVNLRCHSSKVEFIRLFFWRNVSLKKSFRLYLTFKGLNLSSLCIETKSWQKPKPWQKPKSWQTNEFIQYWKNFPKNLTKNSPKTLKKFPNLKISNYLLCSVYSVACINTI